MMMKPKQFDLAWQRAKHVLVTGVTGRAYSTLLPEYNLINLAKAEQVSIEVISRHYCEVDDYHSLVYIIK